MYGLFHGDPYHAAAGHARVLSILSSVPKGNIFNAGSHPFLSSILPDTPGWSVGFSFAMTFTSTFFGLIAGSNYAIN
ncbi:MAG: hypothetical protein ACP5F3_03275, partial [Candidatus Syntrophosphaera sp.]